MQSLRRRRHGRFEWALRAALHSYFDDGTHVESPL